MFKRLCLGISLLSLVSFSNSAPKDLWIKQFGKSGDDVGASVTKDAKGNIYVAGWIGGTPSDQKYTGNSDAFIRKYDTNGKEVWIKQFGTSGLDVAASITTDSKGNIYVAGVTSETLPGEVSLGSGDVFVRKYDSNGKILWTRQFGSNKWDNALSVATDAKGNIYIAGWTNGTFPGQKSLGKQDAFIRKYDTNGKEVWIKQFGTNGDDTGASVTTDFKGNVYVTGWIYGALPGQKSLGGVDAFIRKYDPKGNELWTKQFGASSGDAAASITTDSKGNIYVAGWTDGALPGQVNLDPSNAFIKKYDTNGKEIWIKQFGASGFDVAFSITTDSKGNIYVAGDTSETLFSNLDSGDAFVRKYNSNGKEIWARQFGSNKWDNASSVATDTKGNIYIAGYTVGSLPGQKSLGKSDAFIKKYDSNGTELWTEQFGSKELDSALSVTTDTKGNIYVVGLTYGPITGMTYTAQTDPGKLVTYIRKYDPNRKLMYTHQLDISDDTASISVKTDVKGNIYVGGWVDVAMRNDKSKVYSEAFLYKFIP